MFKYLDLVKVVKPDPRPGEVVILNPEAVNDAMAFFIGAVGRVIDRIPGGYKVWFPVPSFPEKGKFMEFSDRSLKLFHGATEKDYRAAHYPGMSAALPMPPLEAPKVEAEHAEAG